MDAEADTRQNLTAVAVPAALEVAAVGCLLTAWLTFSDVPEDTSMLWRTTVVVAASLLLTLAVAVGGRLWHKRQDRRVRFLVLTSPAMLVLAAAGVLLLRGAPEIAGIALWAWWCACLALPALAVAAVMAYTPPAWSSPGQLRRGLPQPWTASGVAVVVVIAVAVGVVATGRESTFEETMDIQPAVAVDAPPTPPITGQVAYRVDYARGDADKLVPSGAGFARWSSGGSFSDGDLIEGFDGATGERRWSFRAADVNFLGVGATGVGRDSVLVAQSYDELLGLDATTGELLWRSQKGRLFDSDNPNRGVSPSVVMTSQRVPEPPGLTAAGYGDKWEALSPRTGEVMWSRTFRYQCYPYARASADALVVRSCEDPPEVVAEVLDPATGERRGAITLADLGVDPADLGRRTGDVSIEDVRGGTALITVSRYRPERWDTKLVVDIATGRVVARLPGKHQARYLDADSLLVWPVLGRDEPNPLSVLTISANRTLDLRSWWDRGGENETFGLFARSGADWLTFVPDDEAAVRDMADPEHRDTPRLRLIDAAGASRTVADICGAEMRGVPGMAEVPGAVVVQCEGQWVGVR